MVKENMKKAKEAWVEEQCRDIEDNLIRNNSKKAYQVVKDLTSTRKKYNCLTTVQDILKRWTEYCSELYNHRVAGDPEILNVPSGTNTDDHPILREKVEAAVKVLKGGKSAGVDIFHQS